MTYSVVGEQGLRDFGKNGTSFVDTRYTTGPRKGTRHQWRGVELDIDVDAHSEGMFAQQRLSDERVGQITVQARGQHILVAGVQKC